MSNILKTLAAGSVSGEYQISRSLRFNSADSAYLSRTPASAGSRTTWTWSAWVKRGLLGGDRVLFGAWNGADRAAIKFENDQKIQYYEFVGGSVPVAMGSTALFRDLSGWYHVVIAANTNSSAITIYVNNNAVVNISVSAGYNTFINQAIAHGIGTETNGTYDGYMTEVHFVDGQALTPSSFGETNETTGVWSPIAYAGSYGTNGFYLNFSDNSNVTATTLGKDDSGNGNNYTPSGFSVTAGAGNDSLVDTPTPYGDDTGAGGEVRGNYATLNPLDKSTAGGATSNGNLNYAATQASWDMIRSTFGMSSGKWYWEVSVDLSVYGITGIAQSSVILQNNYFNLGQCYGYNAVGGNKYSGTGGVTAYGASWNASNDICGVAFDADAGTLTFYKNGVSQGVAYTGLSGTYFPAQTVYETSTAIVNFGQRPFAYTAPSGFKALVTTNLPEPTVVQGDDYFNTVLYSGNSSTQSITGVGFQPDWVWIKSTSTTGSPHALFDAVRGVSKLLQTDQTSAELNYSADVTSFDSDGFGLTHSASSNITNLSGRTYVAWNWKANGAGVSNTAGTIASTVSVSTTSGFSIVTYTGTGSAATVGHGLGVAPSMILLKNRSNAHAWAVYHTSIGVNDYLVLNTNAAATNYGGIWNGGPTSTIFGIPATFDQWNASGNTYVAYCFADVEGFSKFGSYTGNGSADGPFVFTGFRPAFVLIKRTNVVESWNIVDTSRNPHNQAGANLYPDLTNAESTNNSCDLVSNGFKLRNTWNGANASGSTYIYMAFAENPFKFALAR